MSLNRYYVLQIHLILCGLSSILADIHSGMFVAVNVVVVVGKTADTNLPALNKQHNHKQCLKVERAL